MQTQRENLHEAEHIKQAHTNETDINEIMQTERENHDKADDENDMEQVHDESHIETISQADNQQFKELKNPQIKNIRYLARLLSKKRLLSQNKSQ
jgi:hypothetical protein